MMNHSKIKLLIVSFVNRIVYRMENNIVNIGTLLEHVSDNMLLVVSNVFTSSFSALDFTKHDKQKNKQITFSSNMKK